MGWTYQYRPKGIKERDFWQREFGDSFEIVDLSKVGTTVYIAAKKLKGEGAGLIGAAVMLTQWVPKAEYNFGYKDQDESMGPFEAKAPDRILDLLSPVEDLYQGGDGSAYDGALAARRWREASRAYNAKPKVKAGMKVRFLNPGSESLRDDLIGRTFERLPGRAAIFSDGYTRYRIPFYKSLNYQEVTA
jgi:hypothetical protein